MSRDRPTPPESRRLQVRYAVGAGLLALALVAPLAGMAYGRDVDMARAETILWAHENLEAALVAERFGDAPPPENTWVVNVVDSWSEPVGETWMDPPLEALADPILDGEELREFEFDGRWLSVGRVVEESTVLVTVVGRDDIESATAAARIRWTAMAMAVAGLAFAAAWMVAGRAQAPLDRAHAVNRDFIADAAHELRTPLSIIQASAGQALARERPADAYRESLAEILEAAERAGGSVGDLLEFARLEAGQATPRLAPLRLDLLAEEVAATVRVDGVTVVAEPSEAIVVSADYNLIRQMLLNLTGNAAARAGKVELSSRLDAGRARVEIIDDGPGFDPGVIDHVFERFRRGDRSGSVGLGMAIARTIAELHGGNCQAANRPDGGAVVTVWLPHRAM